MCGKCVPVVLGLAGVALLVAAITSMYFLPDLYSGPRAELGQPYDTRQAKDDPSNPVLLQDQRDYIWDIEHHGLLLNKHGFQRIADALRDANAAALLAQLAPDFQGEL